MTAKEAFEDILTINEILEELTSMNNKNIPNLTITTVCDLLRSYRSLLDVELKRTKLEVFRED